MTQQTRTVGDSLVDLLEHVGVAAAFGVPGGQTIPLYAAARRRGFRHVLTRDERNAASAADAYARGTGTIGVCDATVGPGVTNLISGLGESYASSTPVIAIVADIRSEKEVLRDRAVASQALDQRPMFAPVTKWVGRVHAPDQVEDVFAHALRVATTGRPGPVVIEIPEDVFAADGPAVSGMLAPTDAQNPRHRPAPNASDLGRALEVMLASARPVVLAGGGAKTSDAGPEILRLAGEFGLPVVTSINGKGVIDERHPNAYGVVGVFGHVSASWVLRAADTVLVLGSKHAQFNSFSWRLPSRSQRIVQVDIDGAEIGRAIPAEVGVVADIRQFLELLGKELADRGFDGSWAVPDDWPSQPGTALDEPGIAAEVIIERLDARGDSVAAFVSDASLASGWMAPRITAREGGPRFVAPRGLAGIGWAGGAALGASIAAEDGRVVAVAGDGAAGYWLGEIETAVREQLPILYVILNNAAYGWIAQGESSLGIAPRSTFGAVDFAAVAQGLGAASFRAGTIDQLDAAIAAAFDHPGPSLIDASTSAEASPSVDYGTLDPSQASPLGAYGMS